MRSTSMTCLSAPPSILQRGQLQGELPGRPTRKGPVYEQPFLVRDPDSGETMRLRRITITGRGAGAAFMSAACILEQLQRLIDMRKGTTSLVRREDLDKSAQHCRIKRLW